MSAAPPEVSIIIRSKDREVFLERALRSIEKQRFDLHEIIIANDGGSESRIYKVCENFLASFRNRIHIFSHETSKGRWATANLGVKNSRGKYIAFLDDDDSWNEDFLEKSYEFLEQKKDTLFRGVSSFTFLIHEELRDGGIHYLSTEDYNSWQKAISYNRLITQMNIHWSSFVFEKKILDEVGYFDESLPCLGDWEFLIRFMSRYEIGVLQEFLANYHLRSSAKGIPANSVHNKEHSQIDQQIRNKMLREALHEDKSLLGLLMNQNASFGFLSQALDTVMRKQIPQIHMELKALKEQNQKLLDLLSKKTP